jgi:hypothetical protein
MMQALESDRFRKLLPFAQILVAVLFGGVGLWQRYQILNESEFLRNSTAQFHVWPWPWRFAVILNIPALFAGALLAWPIGDMWPGLPKWTEDAFPLLFVPPLWYWFGAQLDRRWINTDQAGTSPRRNRPWLLLSAFVLASIIGAALPYRYLGYTGYIPYGVLLWVATVVRLLSKPRRSGC